MTKYYSSERLKEITFTNEINQDLCIYDRKNQDKMITLIHDMDIEINNLQQRIDKAVEYLTDEDRELLEDSYYKVSKLDLTEELLNILRGEDNE